MREAAQAESAGELEKAARLYKRAQKLAGPSSAVSREIALFIHELTGESYQEPKEPRSYRGLKIAFLLLIFLSGLLGGAYVAWPYLWPEGRLRVTSSPDGAEVYVDSRPLGKTPLEVTVKAGLREVRIEKAHYAAQTANVEVQRDRNKEVEFELLRPVEILCNKDGAEVYKGANRLSTIRSGSAKLELSPGTHNLTMQLEGYETEEFTVEVPASGDMTTPSVTLSATPGKMVVKSEPDSAEIWIRRGTTYRLALTADQSSLLEPVAEKLKSHKESPFFSEDGKTLYLGIFDDQKEAEKKAQAVEREHKIQFEVAATQTNLETFDLYSPVFRGKPNEVKTLFQEWKDKDPPVSANQDNTVLYFGSFASRTEADAHKRLIGKSLKVDLSVESFPSNQYRFFGVTPRTLSLEPGQVTIRLKKEGHRASITALALEAGTTKELNLQLAPQPGQLKVGSKPAGATVVLNGEKKGTTPLELDGLAPGKYKIQVKKSGYISAGGELTVPPGGTKAYSPTLKKMPAPQPPPRYNPPPRYTPPPYRPPPRPSGGGRVVGGGRS